MPPVHYHTHKQTENLSAGIVCKYSCFHAAIKFTGLRHRYMV